MSHYEKCSDQWFQDGVDTSVNPKGETNTYKRKEISNSERQKGRSENYYQMSSLDRWNEDKKLGLLNFEPEEK
jgi:hypothetical protein